MQVISLATWTVLVGHGVKIGTSAHFQGLLFSHKQER